VDREESTSGVALIQSVHYRGLRSGCAAAGQADAKYASTGKRPNENRFTHGQRLYAGS
jgi:hypothetical protein